MEQNNIDRIPRTALYIRVSTEEQALHGLSLEAQENALRKWANDHQCRIVDAYIDGGKTARKSLKSRTELMRLLSDVENDKIDLIIFTKLDRWFRNIKDYYKVQEVLEKHNVNWKTIFENYDTSNANGRLYVNIMLSLAQDEADRTSERIKAVFANKREQGLITTHRLVSGYKNDNGRLVIDPDTVDLARDIFDTYYKCQSIRETSKTLSRKYDRNISRDRVKKALKSRMYIGEYHGIPNFCEPIIDKKMFGEIQEILKSKNIKRTPSGRDYLFTGILLCAECGRTLRAASCAQTRKKSGETKKYASYRCETYWNGYKQCPHKRIMNEMKIERFLLDNIMPLAKQFVEETEIKLRQVNESKPKTDIAKIHRQIERYKYLFINEAIDEQEFNQNYTELNNQLLQFEKPERKPNLEPLKQFIANGIDESYMNADNKAKRAFWREIINYIIMDKDGNMRIEFKT